MRSLLLSVHAVLAALVLASPAHAAGATGATGATDTGAGAGTADPWQRLQGGRHVLLVRHSATEPGVGDPPGFALGDCSTQRNLSAPGRADAAALGAALRQHGVPVGRVLSSRWCRCQDTARLAFGRAEPVPMLDSILDDDPAVRERKLADLRRLLAGYGTTGNLVLVTHDVNIRALTGERLAQGEALVATARADGSLALVGRLAVPKSAEAVR